MSDLTAELNLALCVDNDDTADYLTQTAGLRGSLNTIDGLFNTTTGHNHSGAHQGGGFQDLSPSRDLTVGRNLLVNGTATVLGNTHLATLQVDSTLTVGGAASMSSTLTVTGNLVANGGVNATYVWASSYVTAGPAISAAAGDLNANRSNGTGYVFLGNGSHYLGFDGSNYVLPTSPLVAGGSISIPTNATFGSGGGMLWFDGANTVLQAHASGLRFVNAANSVQFAGFDASGNYTQNTGSSALGQTTAGGYAAVVAANATQQPHIESGSVTLSPTGGASSTFGSVAAQTITYARAFASVPVIIVNGPANSVGGDVANYACGATAASNTQAVIRCQTNQSGTQTVQVQWIAFGV